MYKDGKKEPLNSRFNVEGRHISIYQEKTKKKCHECSNEASNKVYVSTKERVINPHWGEKERPSENYMN